jgi:hypothetical protein
MTINPQDISGLQMALGNLIKTVEAETTWIGIGDDRCSVPTSTEIKSAAFVGLIAFTIKNVPLTSSIAASETQLHHPKPAHQGLCIARHKHM